MRRALALTLAVFILAVAVCALGDGLLAVTAGEARDLKNRAVLAVENGDIPHAAELMTQLAQLWRQRAPAMEAFACNDAIHEVKVGIIDARICLDLGDHAGFFHAMARLGESLPVGGTDSP